MESELHLAWLEFKEYWDVGGRRSRLPSIPFYRLLRTYLSPFLRLFLKLRMHGLNNIPRKGKIILAANHLSHVDPIMVIAAARRTTHYMAKDGHFEKPLMRTLMNQTGQIETRRESGASDALKKSVKVLKASRSLGIFPEGTRSKRQEKPYLLPGKTGVARIASAQPDALVIPVALIGTREMMQPGKDKIPKLWKQITINAGEGITWYDWLSHPNGGNMSVESLLVLRQKEEHEIRKELSNLYRKFTDQLMGSISALGAP